MSNFRKQMVHKKIKLKNLNKIINIFRKIHKKMKKMYLLSQT